MLHRALRRAGITAELHVFEAMPHGGFHGAPEDAESLGEQARFMSEYLTWFSGQVIAGALERRDAYRHYYATKLTSKTRSVSWYSRKREICPSRI